MKIKYMPLTLAMLSLSACSASVSSSNVITEENEKITSTYEPESSSINKPDVSTEVANAETTEEASYEITEETTEEITEAVIYDYYYPSVIHVIGNEVNDEKYINLFYDDAAHVSEVEIFNGETSKNYSFTYDKSGRLTKKAKNGIDILTNEFNDKDKVVDIKKYDDNGILTEHTIEYYVEVTNIYPLEIKPLMTIQLDTEGSTVQTITYNYDDAEIIGIDYYDSANQLTAISKELNGEIIYYQMTTSDSMSTSYTTDESGRIASVTSHVLNPMGAFNDTVKTYEYNEDNTFIIKKLVTNGVYTGSTEETYKYIDDKKIIISSVQKDAADTITSKSTYSYDENGKILNEQYEDLSLSSGQLQISKFIIYNTDEKPIITIRNNDDGSQESQIIILYGKYGEVLYALNTSNDYLDITALEDLDLSIVVHNINKINTDDLGNITSFAGSDSNAIITYIGID